MSWLEELPGAEAQLKYRRLLPPDPPRRAAYQGRWASLLEALGLQPYTYQAEAFSLLEEGKHLVLATSTASGKSLVFQVPILQALLEGQSALLIYPTKALARDQLRRLRVLAERLGLEGIFPYDGDTSPRLRQRARMEGSVLLTNPDMLHFGILPNHPKWAPWLERLRYVVLDELHAYRGAFGSHLALILRRLFRLLAHYGAHPQVIATSATISNPKEHAEMLTGLPFVALEARPSRSLREFAVWVPKALGEERRSANLEAALLARAAAERHIKTLVFVNGRRTAELVARYAQHPAVRPYRAGYPATLRRHLEEALERGEISVLVSTSALELGIEVGGLEAVILLGFPGSLSSFWQRLGRAGRGEGRAWVIWIPREDPLDAYYEAHPERLIEGVPEAAVAEPDNPVLRPLHLHCAAREAPLAPGEELVVGLEAELRWRDGRGYTPKARPHRELLLRGLGWSFTLKDSEGQVLGQLDERQAYTETYPGAIYLHAGESYLVRNLDLRAREVILLPALEDYYTEPRIEIDVDLEEEEPVAEGLWVGRVRLREQVVGYVKKRFYSEAVLAEVALELPPLSFPTEALWFAPPPFPEAELPNALHALEHTLIGLMPLFFLVERQDLGGVSYPSYPGRGPLMFIYDGYPGGLGYARRAARRFPELLEAASELLASCPCAEGCPRCILSPKCGNGNQYLDKAGALKLARLSSSSYWKG